MHRFRIILDTNLYISALLRSGSFETIQAIFKAAFENRYELLIPAEQLTELRQAVRSKPYLAARIENSSLESLLSALIEIAEVLPALEGELPRRFRDPRDDYLYAVALASSADIIVSGDRDLLDERDTIDTPRIFSPIELLRFLND